jgi:hypothetical protein
MNQIHLKMTLDITYIPNGVTPDYLIKRLANLLDHAAGEGMFTGDSEAEVESWYFETQEILHPPVEPDNEMGNNGEKIKQYPEDNPREVR